MLIIKHPVSWLILSALAACGSDPSPMSREYSKPVSTVSRITAEVLLEQGFRIDSDVHETGEAKIEAGREGGRVVVRSRSVEPERTAVNVRVDGLPRKTGEDLLNRITERVAGEDSALPVLILSTLEFRYPQTLEGCVAAADDAFFRIGLPAPEREVAPDRARFSSRGNQETAEIRLSTEIPERVRAVFEAGAETKEQAEQLARQLREEFEYALVEAR